MGSVIKLVTGKLTIVKFPPAPLKSENTAANIAETRKEATMHVY